MWRAWDQGVFSAGEGPAFAPWTDWRGRPGEGPLSLVRAGLLAASPHNSQPWLFRVTENRVDLYADTSRNLGTFDPFLREMHIGLGCAVENMIHAAPHHGYRARVTLSKGSLSPNPAHRDPSLVARIDLTEMTPEPQVAFDALPKRRTNRGPYDPDRALGRTYLLNMRLMIPKGMKAVVAHLEDQEAEKAELGQAILDATEAIIADEEMTRDSDRWFRHRWSDVQKFRDGVTIDTAGLEPFVTAAAKMLPALSAKKSHEYWLRETREVQLPTAPVLGVIGVPNPYDRIQALEAGRLWQLYHLWATLHGVALQPLNQILERIDRLRALGKRSTTPPVLVRMLRGRGVHPMFVFRMGFPLRAANPSPRRPVEQVLMKR